MVSNGLSCIQYSRSNRRVALPTPRVSPLLEQLKGQPLGRNQSVRVSEQKLQLAPVCPRIEPCANPAARPHIRWDKEAIRRRLDHQLLIAGSGLEPDGRTAGSMMFI